MVARRRQSLASWVQSGAQMAGPPQIGGHLPGFGARVGQRLTNFWCTRLGVARLGSGESGSTRGEPGAGPAQATRWLFPRPLRAPVVANDKRSRVARIATGSKPSPPPRRSGGRASRLSGKPAPQIGSDDVKRSRGGSGGRCVGRCPRLVGAVQLESLCAGLREKGLWLGLISGQALLSVAPVHERV
jgi:hypothetical protein